MIIKNDLHERIGLIDSCQWCGKNCSFMKFCDGLCVYCADLMQSKEKTELIEGLAKATLEVVRLRLQIQNAEDRGFDI